MKKQSAPSPKPTGSASALIDARIEELGDWRGEMLSQLRQLIRQAAPDAVEEWKWRGTPVWSHGGGICTGETYKSVVKLTFFKGASLDDPSGLFNSSLEGNTRRAIDFHDGDPVDKKAFHALIRAAVALNSSSASGKARPASRAQGSKPAQGSKTAQRSKPTQGSKPAQGSKTAHRSKTAKAARTARAK
jgi:hypothetical protein